MMNADEVAAGPVHVSIMRAPRDGTRLDTIAHVLEENSALKVPHGDYGALYMQQPLGPHPLRANSRMDSTYVLAYPSRIVGEQGEFRLEKLRLNGDTVFAHTIRYRPIRFDSRRADSVAAAIGDRIKDYPNFQITAAEATRKVRAALYVPEYFPTVSGGFVDGTGRIFVRREEVSGSATWNVFDARGRRTGQFALPLTVRLLQAAGDRIYGTWRDSLDVQYIVTYKLVR
jgi:hypothetical protein